MDVSKVRLRVKKADGDDLKPEPRTRERRKAEVSEEADSSVGPINLSIKKSGKTNFDGESAKKPVSELLKDKLCDRRAEKRAAPRNEGKETSSKKARIKETLPSVERQDGKKDKEAKKPEKVVKPAEKVTKGRLKKEEKAAKEKKETVAKNQDGPEEVKRADLQKKQQNQRMEKEMRTKEQKQKEEEERRVRKRQEDERLEREKEEKEQKQRKEEEREWQEKERIERETRERELKQKEQEERARVEKEKREKEEEERRERKRLEREKRASELKQEEERRERELREWELKHQEEEERRKKEMLLKGSKREEKEVGPVQAFRKAPARKATKKQKGTVKRDELKSPNHEESQPKVVKRKAESAKEEKPKRKKVNSPHTSKNTPGEVKRSKGNGRQSRKTNKSAVGTEVPSMCMDTDKAAKALELSSEPEKLQQSPVQDQTSAEKPSHTSEELRVTKKPALEGEVRGLKATSERKATEEARTSSDIDSGTDSPTLDLSKPPCSRSQEGEDDEGIHSHDGGSDISDCASEVSYDSGLNGKLPETPTEELPSPTQLLSHTCVFCDRTFPLEMDYRRHLNRHLVNVYYLDTAAQRNK